MFSSAICFFLLQSSVYWVCRKKRDFWIVWLLSRVVPVAQTKRMELNQKYWEGFFLVLLFTSTIFCVLSVKEKEGFASCLATVSYCPCGLNKMCGVESEILGRVFSCAICCFLLQSSVYWVGLKKRGISELLGYCLLSALWFKLYMWRRLWNIGKDVFTVVCCFLLQFLCIDCGGKRGMSELFGYCLLSFLWLRLNGVKSDTEAVF